MAPGEQSCRCPGCGTCEAHDLMPALKAEAKALKDQVREVKRLALGMAVLHQRAVGGNILPDAQKVGLVKVLKAVGVTKEELDALVKSY